MASNNAPQQEIQKDLDATFQAIQQPQQEAERCPEAGEHEDAVDSGQLHSMPVATALPLPSYPPPPKNNSLESSGGRVSPHTRIPLPLPAKGLLPSGPGEELIYENGADWDLMDMDCFGPASNEPQRPRWLSSLHSVIFIITCALAVFIVFRNVLTW